MSAPPTLQPNTLGKSSLVLGIIGSFFVVMVGLCAGVGKQNGWLEQVGAILFVVGGSFAFLGLLGGVLGVLGLFGRNRSRATAIAGLLLGVFTVVLFIAILNGVR
jgi:uncharacterized membrane protein